MTHKEKLMTIFNANLTKTYFLWLVLITVYAMQTKNPVSYLTSFLFYHRSPSLGNLELWALIIPRKHEVRKTGTTIFSHPKWLSLNLHRRGFSIDHSLNARCLKLMHVEFCSRVQSCASCQFQKVKDKPNTETYWHLENPRIEHTTRRWNGNKDFSTLFQTNCLIELVKFVWPVPGSNTITCHLF